MCSTKGIQTSLWMGCPIRILKAHRLYAAPLERFAGLRVLHRLAAPRHPPRPLCSLSLLRHVFCPGSLLQLLYGKIEEKSILFLNVHCRFPDNWRVENSQATLLVRPAEQVRSTWEWMSL